MLADGFYDNGLITFSLSEKGNQLDVFCKTEGVDYQHLLSETNSRKPLFFKRKQPKAKSVRLSGKH